MPQPKRTKQEGLSPPLSPSMAIPNNTNPQLATPQKETASSDLPAKKIPSTNLHQLPPELILNITSYLSPIELASMRPVCKQLYAKTLPAPPLNHQAWCRFHHVVEAQAREIPRRLACTSCMRFLPRASFQDSQNTRRCDRMSGRICFQCGVMHGIHNVSYFIWQKDVCFACFACSRPKKVTEEAQYDVCPPGLPLPGMVLKPHRGNKRWCKQCWRAVVLHTNAMTKLIYG